MTAKKDNPFEEPVVLDVEQAGNQTAENAGDKEPMDFETLESEALDAARQEVARCAMPCCVCRRRQKTPANA